MEIRAISPIETLELRQKILRQDFEVDQCVLPGDMDSTTHHFGCIIDHKIVGIVSIYKRKNLELYSGSGFQIRAMATSEAYRGKGIGIKLLNVAEDKAFSLGANYIWANARIAAIGFYKKSGYIISENEFEIVGVGKHVLVLQAQA